MTEYVYEICGEGYDGLDWIKAQGIIDATTVSCGGYAGGQAFANACKAVGISPLLNCGNDGISCPQGGDPTAFAQNAVNMGFQGLGGESESAAHMAAYQRVITALNYGGEGLVPNQDSYGNIGFPASAGKQTISYIESYNFPATLVPNDCYNAMLHAAKMGCPEVGIMIGGWMPVTAQPYRDLANRVLDAKSRFSGFCFWWGIGTNMKVTVQKWLSVIKDLQRDFPPTNIQLKDRIAGVKPTPTPVPPVIRPIPPPATTNADGYIFVRGTDSSLWMQELRNGQWSGWYSLGGIIIDQPNQEWLSGGTSMIVWATGTDKAVWFRISTNGQWSDWKSRGGQVK